MPVAITSPARGFPRSLIFQRSLHKIYNMHKVVIDFVESRDIEAAIVPERLSRVC